jgi:hypothetical protein
MSPQKTEVTTALTETNLRPRSDLVCPTAFKVQSLTQRKAWSFDGTFQPMQAFDRRIMNIGIATV